MKKTLISSCLILSACFTCAAEGTVFNNPNNKVYFGLRLGGEITCPGALKEDNIGIKMYKNGGGVEFGGICNIPVVSNLFVEPGVKFYYNTYSVKKEFLNLVDDHVNSVSNNKFGMRIPVMVGYGFDFTQDVRLSIFTGPELEIGFSAKESVKENHVSVSENLYEDGGLRRTDLLWGFGAGVTYQKFYVGISGGLGMLNMIDDDDVKFHENRVTISLGYNF